MAIIKENVTLTWKSGKTIVVGNIDYLPKKNALVLHPTEAEDSGYLVLSANLDNDEIRPQSGCVFVRDYSERKGMFAALVAAGVVANEHLRKIRGPFDSVFYEARVLMQ